MDKTNIHHIHFISQTTIYIWVFYRDPEMRIRTNQKTLFVSSIYR